MEIFVGVITIVIIGFGLFFAVDVMARKKEIYDESFNKKKKEQDTLKNYCLMDKDRLLVIEKTLILRIEGLKSKIEAETEMLIMCNAGSLCENEKKSVYFLEKELYLIEQAKKVKDSIDSVKYPQIEL